MEGDEQSPDHKATIPDPRDTVGCLWGQTDPAGLHFGGARMFLSIIPNEAENTRYIERTAERLRAMAAHTTGLEGADPAVVRARIRSMDRHARRQAGSSQSVA